MGRHSASDEDVDELIAPEAGRAAVIPNGRHSVAEEPLGDAHLVAESETERLPSLLVESPFSRLLTVRTQPVPRIDPAAAAGPEVAVERDAVASGRVAPDVAQTPAAARSSGTRGDLQLLRETPRLRAWCAAVVVFPFLIFTAVLIALGRTDLFLIWFWVPTVLAGILVGALLDRAHARRRKLPSAHDY
jgi:hypothetical protein